MSFKHALNELAFSTYDESSAYWAGFLAADGNVRISTAGVRQIRVYLGIKDYDHLSKFKSFLRSGHKIGVSEKYRRCSLEVSSKPLYEDLSALFNITERKSFTYKFPSQLPSGLQSHFIRGYFDGDGCICESFSNKNSITASYTASYLGTDSFISDTRNLILQNLSGIKTSVQPHPASVGISLLKMNTNSAHRFLDWIYEESSENIRLDGKYD